jgi:hypothetical protein
MRQDWNGVSDNEKDEDEDTEDNKHVSMFTNVSALSPVVDMLSHLLE